MHNGFQTAVVPPTTVEDTDLGLSAEARALAHNREVTLAAIEVAARNRDAAAVLRLASDLSGQQRLLLSPA